MKIAIVGTGYVGLVTGTCFAEMGTETYCIDVDETKINNLKEGIIPIYEPGLEEMVKRNYKAGRLHFSTNLKEILPDVDVVFSAVGTPPNEDGSADLKYVRSVAKTIGENINDYTLVVTKSTVPVGTSDLVKEIIATELKKRGREDIPFEVASNPEFLKEGDAINDFMSPDRVVVGVESEKGKKLMERLYKPFMMNKYRIIFTDIRSAEMIKYASNAMLATRISFMNDIANLCEILGADVNMVRRGVGSDTRIGNKFLFPGTGYGGSCFPKDVQALIKTGQDNNYNLRILKAVEAVNEDQKKILFEKLKKHYNGDIKGKTVAMWGLSFKPETDDMREAPSLVLIDKLTAAGVRIKAYDPIAMDEAKRIVGNKIEYASDAYDSLIDADALLMVTEWKEFRLPNWNVVNKLLKEPLIIDGRNIYDRQELEEKGFTYLNIGG